MTLIIKIMALVFALSHVLSMVASTSPHEEHVSYGDAIRSYGEDLSESLISAYINVTRRVGNEWLWKMEEAGRYGRGHVGPAFGVLVHVTAEEHPYDHTGCSLPLYSTRSDRRLPPNGQPWIALIQRGSCNFEVKVENAFRSHAVAVLVYNDRDSTSLEKMQLSTDTDRNISAIFTYKSKGEELAKLVENDNKVLVHISIASRSTSRAATINRTSVLFVSITFIVLMIIALAWLVFYYVQRFRYIHAKDRLSRRLCNAAKKALSKIPTKNIKSDDKEVEEGECCAICIEPYKISDVLRMLPCRHEFHKSCIDPWLLEHRTCPMCKMDILKHYGFMFTGSQESILHMEIEEVVGLGSSVSQESDSPRRGGVSPLPQIRTVVLNDRRRSYSSTDIDEGSSRASTPDETTPSLSISHRTPVHPDLCANCIAAGLVKNDESHDDSDTGSSPSTPTPLTRQKYTQVLKSDSKDNL